MSLRAAFENWLLRRALPLSGPGPLMRRVFKFPLLLDRLGLWFLIPSHVLILTTTGRRSGRPHRTPVEYGYDTRRDACWVMAGWSGNTDWYRNARANPQVRVRLPGRAFAALAIPASEDETVELMSEILRINPGSIRIYERWAGRPLENTPASLRTACGAFPCLWLKETPA